MPADAQTWYAAASDQNLYQGDVVDGVPVVFMPPAGDRPWTVLKPSPPTSRDQALKGVLPKNFYPRPKEPDPEVWSENQELVLAKGVKSRVSILTQTCDLGHRNFVQVAPVYPAAQLNDLKRGSLRSLDIIYMFFLPADVDGFAEAFVDLSQIASVHRSYLRTPRVIKRLSPTATVALQAHLADYFGRPFGFNTRDLVPTSGEYACVACFHQRLLIELSKQTAGEKFSACTACGIDALWIWIR